MLSCSRDNSRLASEVLLVAFFSIPISPASTVSLLLVGYAGNSGDFHGIVIDGCAFDRHSVATAVSVANVWGGLSLS